MRTITAAWERREFSRVEWADSDIEFLLADGADPHAWRGVAGCVIRIVAKRLNRTSAPLGGGNVHQIPLAAEHPGLETLGGIARGE